MNDAIKKLAESLGYTIKEAAYSYPDAGKDAPPGVKQEIAHFKKMDSEYKSTTPLLYHLLGSGTPDYKMGQEDANYTAKSPGKKQCQNCTYAYKALDGGKYICSQITGEIDPPGWCRLWKEFKTNMIKKPKPQ